MILAILVAYVVHELGHVLCALAQGKRIKSLRLTWLGPCITRERGSPLQNICSSLAGCAVNLGLLVIARVHGWNYTEMANFSMMVNLLPLKNSDGRHAWEHYQEWRWNGLVERVRVAK